MESLGLQDFGRMQEIAGVLMRHGLGEAVRRLGMADALERAGHALHRDNAAELARLSPPEQVRRAFEELGPTFVKLGQVLAGRGDLLDASWLHELSKLHSRVPPVPPDELRRQLREDLGGEPEVVFAHFETEPLAAASIAQVHRARLHDGSEVIVKVRRPGIETVIEADLRLLARLAGVAERQWPALAPYRPQQLVHEFARSLRRELNLAAECRHAERVAANLAPLGYVAIPRVHWAHTGPRMNVQDFVDGLPGEDLAAVDAAGLDRKVLARRGAQAVLKMIVEDGFFHADPHPGNVFYLPGNRLAFIDFGMVGRLSPRRREELLNLLLGLVQRDPPAVAEVLLDWAGDTRGVDIAQLESAIEEFVDQYHGTPLAQLNLGQMLTEVTDVLRAQSLALPGDLALLIKAFVSLESMGRGLDPDFHVAQEALPLLQRVLRGRYKPAVLGKRAWQAAVKLAATAEKLPHDISRLLRRARHGQMRIGLELAHLQRVGNQLDRAATRLSMAILIAALIIGSSIVMTVGGGPTLFGLPAFGFLGFIGAFGGAIWLVRSIRSEERHDD